MYFYNYNGKIITNEKESPIQAKRLEWVNKRQTMNWFVESKDGSEPSTDYK